MQVSDTVRYTQLLDVYGNVLTQKQRSILTDYLCFDNTLSEIAEAHNTTRQAINDIISRSVSRLDEFEQKLGFCDKLEKLKTDLKNFEQSCKLDDLKQKIAQIINTLEV